MAMAVDSEFDPFKQCFISDDVEFYGSAASPNSTTPSEDIWKKFDDMDLEFFPTPPLSPSHPSSDGEDTGGGGGTNAPLFADSDKLQRVLSEILEDEPVWMTQSLTFVGADSKPTVPTVPTVQRNASPARISIGSHKSNFLIQDCMWSAIQAEERRRQMQAEKAAKNSRLTGHTGGLASGGVSGDFSSGECVDPTSVFPYPLSDTRLDFSSTTPSDSEEEIDVVTVEKKCPPSSTSSSSSSSSSHNVPRTIIIKRHSKHSRKHGAQMFKVVKRCSSNKSILTKVPSMKKLNKMNLAKHVNLEDVKRVLENTLSSSSHSSKHSKRAYNSSRGSSRGSSLGSSRHSSQVSSDSEDCDRRANHNVLERRRREDLRTSFFKLRDQVPDLQSQERAAKIVILKKATDHVHQLRGEEQSMARHQDALRRRQRALMQRLRQLEESK